MARTTAEYLANAEECLRLAKEVRSEAQRDTLLRMAATWEKLAKERQAMLTKQQQD